MKTHRDQIKHLINRLYEPANTSDYDVKMTTSNVYNDLCSIIPANAFDEFDVIDVLQELGFEAQYESKERTIHNEKTGEEKTEEYDDLCYFWYMKKKVK